MRTEAGAVTVLAGANGTGKSTLLRIAAGAASPSGRVLRRPAVVGYLPAPFPASSRLSVRAYLRRVAATHGTPSATATARYLLADAVRGQRTLVPVVVFLLVVGILVAGDHSAAPGPWPGTVLALYPAAAWIALAVAGTEGPLERAMTTASAGGPGVVTGALVLAALALDAPLVAVAVAAPALVSGFPAAVVAPGVLAHLAAAATGTAVGLVLAPPLVTRVGWSAAAITVVVVVTATAPGVPPVGTAVRALTVAGSPVGLVGDAVLGVALLALAAALSGLAVARV